MSRIAVIGESPRIDGYAAAGAVVYPATGSDEVRRRWNDLPDDVEVVVLSPDAAAVLTDRLDDRLVAVLP